MNLTEQYALAEAKARRPIADFVANVAQLNNGAMTEIADYVMTQSPAFRSRFIERCAAMISAVADRDAD